MTAIWWVLAALLVVGGLAGTVLPALPGPPMVFAGLFIAAWAGGFEQVGWTTIGILGLLTAVAWLIDFLAAALGAKRLGASQRAFWGAAFGAVAGMFFGLPGILLGPFVGAVAAELSAGRDMQQAGRAGYGAWIGVILGTAAKLAITFLMVGIFAFAAWFSGG
ncbi:MAG: DUF456 family protein [Xanthomonadales bacterium]|nr:DUF456 family protein [Xanthomonadales bacterium]NIN58919.1 DUF456 family protein [Xanthomonadales bacterium]NIN74188.1 DUF456 family protein [Xanthomonadales bacterium]NIO13859.1 DUF456 family protein [Xanthomonadales bacterium]NIP11312.1 DUF456 family protein [Xanthomonadales bacterium]